MLKGQTQEKTRTLPSPEKPLRFSLRCSGDFSVGACSKTCDFALCDLKNWEFAKGGGQNVSCNFGGGKKYHKAPPPKPVLEASESGICLVCARFL